MFVTDSLRTPAERSAGSTVSRVFRGIFIGVLAALLTACSANGGSPPTDSSSSSSTTESERTVAEVASVVAQQRASIERLSEDLDGCPTINKPNQVACAFVVQRAPLEGSAVVKAFDEKVAGDVPDEVMDPLRGDLPCRGGPFRGAGRRMREHEAQQ